jgi:hypothetical protein
MRVLPHLQNTGGFFIAVLEKVDSSWAIKDIEEEAEKQAIVQAVTTDIKMEPEEKVEAVDSEVVNGKQEEDDARPPKEKKDGKGKQYR